MVCIVKTIVNSLIDTAEAELFFFGQLIGNWNREVSMIKILVDSLGHSRIEYLILWAVNWKSEPRAVYSKYINWFEPTSNEIL